MATGGFPGVTGFPNDEVLTTGLAGIFGGIFTIGSWFGGFCGLGGGTFCWRRGEGLLEGGGGGRRLGRGEDLGVFP